MDWTEIQIHVPVAQLDAAESIAHMVVPYGIYVEDYSRLEEEVLEIAHIDLIDEDLLDKDRSTGIIHIYIAPQERPSEAMAFLRERLQTADISYEITSASCKAADWENNWKQYFKPIPIGKTLLIRPVWDEDYDAAGRKVLHLEPGLAFGTGSHATTRLCLEALERQVKPGDSVLDVGCGSGILSVGALLLGAANATGVDIDQLAVKTARENAARNGFDKTKFTVEHGNLAEKIHGQFDVIAANIVADVIIRFAPEVSRLLKTAGVLLVSGIIDQREAEVAAALREAGLTVQHRTELENWVCLELGFSAH